MPARVIKFVPLFRGTVDGASVYPREVVKEALRRNAAAVIALDHLVATNDAIVSFAERGLL